MLSTFPGSCDINKLTANPNAVLLFPESDNTRNAKYEHIKVGAFLLQVRLMGLLGERFETDKVMHADFGLESNKRSYQKPKFRCRQKSA